jgi:antitoxin (DNA-binding transcriptional repressor) of toxin-antitoxin stability system
MKAVGLRELKNRLSEYIRDVRRGETVLVTDRGEVVAEIGPPGYSTTAELYPLALVALAREGGATLGQPNDRRAYPKRPGVLKPGRAAAMLNEERGDR